MNSITTVMPLSWCLTDWKDFIVLYLQPVGSQEAQQILPARGTACIFDKLCSVVTMVCFAFYSFCAPNQSYTHLNHIFQKYVFIHLFLFGLEPVAGRIKGGLQNTTGQRYSLHSGLCPILLRFGSHLTFLHSKLQFYTLWNNFFLRVHLNICSFIFKISHTLLGITFSMNSFTFCPLLISL